MLDEFGLKTWSRQSVCAGGNQLVKIWLRNGISVTTESTRAFCCTQGRSWLLEVFGRRKIGFIARFRGDLKGFL